MNHALCECAQVFIWWCRESDSEYTDTLHMCTCTHTHRKCLAGCNDNPRTHSNPLGTEVMPSRSVNATECLDWVSTYSSLTEAAGSPITRANPLTHTYTHEVAHCVHAHTRRTAVTAATAAASVPPSLSASLREALLGPMEGTSL